MPIRIARENELATFAQPMSTSVATRTDEEQ
jgi:hypothetical protein